MDKYRYHTDNTLPKNEEIFVFGSNESGIHGAGAALVAKEKFGAKYGAGFGLIGMSFAIPTKDWYVNTLSIDKIKFYIDRFAAYTQNSCDTEFFVTRVGCGLAGYVDSQIAPLFANCNAERCIFPEQWKEFLEI